ncbi:hypothetical protein NKDENANG_00966 [Candidatus Entotheonellaceae bacterium PAL068K]
MSLPTKSLQNWLANQAPGIVISVIVLVGAFVLIQDMRTQHNTQIEGLSAEIKRLSETHNEEIMKLLEGNQTRNNQLMADIGQKIDKLMDAMHLVDKEIGTLGVTVEIISGRTQRSRQDLRKVLAR